MKKCSKSQKKEGNKKNSKKSSTLAPLFGILKAVTTANI